MKRNLTDIIGIPEEAVSKITKITVTGMGSIYMEYYGRLVLYTDEEICVKNDEFLIKVAGKGLKIDAIDKNFVEISGTILCISYEN